MVINIQCHFTPGRRAYFCLFFHGIAAFKIFLLGGNQEYKKMKAAPTMAKEAEKGQPQSYLRENVLVQCILSMHFERMFSSGVTTYVLTAPNEAPLEKLLSPLRMMLGAIFRPILSSSRSNLKLTFVFAFFTTSYWPLIEGLEMSWWPYY